MQRRVIPTSERNFLFGFFSLAFAVMVTYVYVNPYVGRDYFNYIDIFERILEGSYLREPIFVGVVYALDFLGLNAHHIMFVFRAMFFFLILRFLLKKESSLFSILFFFLVPNIFIGSLNALQTWLAIAVFLQAFVTSDSRDVSKKRVFLFAVLAMGFHLAGLVFIFALIIFIFSRYMNPVKLSVLVFTGAVVSYFIGSYVLSTLGFSKYSLAESPVGFSSVIMSFIISSFIIYVYRFKGSNFDVYSSCFALLLCGLTVLLYLFSLDNKIFLRMLNFALMFFLFSFVHFSNGFRGGQRFCIKSSFILVLFINLGLTLGSLPDDMLNFHQSYHFFTGGAFHGF